MGANFGKKICFSDDGKCSIPEWAVLVTAGILFLLLLTIVVLSVCLFRACKKGKKRKLLEEGVTDDTCEGDVHYAELQNLPASSGKKSGGGIRPVSLAILDSDYATVAVLKEPPSEENCSNDHQKEDSGVEEGVKEDHLYVEAGYISYYDQE